jgi:cell wall-associated NlpC family hydrolase
MMVTRADVIAEARRWKETRWHHQGRNSAGIDCIGLVIMVSHALGLSDFDITDYARQPDPKMMRGLLAAHMDPIAKPEPGDVLLMRFEKEPQHVAILTDIGIIHAYAQARKVVEHRLDSLWRSRIVGAYRYKGLE